MAVAQCRRCATASRRLRHIWRRAAASATPYGHDPRRQPSRSSR
jgi:hypothetical protein